MPKRKPQAKPTDTPTPPTLFDPLTDAPPAPGPAPEPDQPGHEPPGPAPDAWAVITRFDINREFNPIREAILAAMDSWPERYCSTLVSKLLSLTKKIASERGITIQEVDLGPPADVPPTGERPSQG